MFLKYFYYIFLFITKQCIKYCDTYYVEDLEKYPLDNKEQIERCKDFRDLVFEQIKTLLHDNKGKVLDTHKQIKQTKTKIKA